MKSDRPVESIGGAISFATAQLRAGGLSSPRLDAELLLGHLLDRSRTQLAIDSTDPVDPVTVTQLNSLLARRLDGEPVAYLIGHREFMGHDFVVGPGVLVPRPETELLVEYALAELDRRWPSGPVRVLDLCSGSGAIALSLALEIAHTIAPQVRSQRSFTTIKAVLATRTSLGLIFRNMPWRMHGPIGRIWDSKMSSNLSKAISWPGPTVPGI